MDVRGVTPWMSAALCCLIKLQHTTLSVLVDSLTLLLISIHNEEKLITQFFKNCLTACLTLSNNYLTLASHLFFYKNLTFIGQ